MPPKPQIDSLSDARAQLDDAEAALAKAQDRLARAKTPFGRAAGKIAVWRASGDVFDSGEHLEIATDLRRMLAADEHPPTS